MLHRCTPDRPLGCRSPTVAHPARHAFTIAKTACTAFVTSTFAKPLAYRWKGFDSASAWYVRGRGYHDLLLGGFKRTYPANVIKKAEEALAVFRLQAGEEGGADEAIRRAHERNARGGLLVRWMLEHELGKDVKLAVFLCSPLQTFLNEGYANEGKVTTYRQHVTSLSSSSSLADQTDVAALDAMRTEAFKSNWYLLSGSAGHKVILKYSKMLTNFAGAGTPWRGLKTTRDEQHSCCPEILITMADTFKRLEHDLKVLPKLRIFEAVLEPGFVEMRGLVIDSMWQKHESCDQCIDPYFTAPWLRRLRHRRHKRRAHHIIRDVGSLLAVNSTAVERKHLLGQAAKPRKEGRAPGVSSVQKTTHVMSIREASQRMRNVVMNKILAKKEGQQSCRRSFAQRLSSLSIGTAKRSRQAPDAHGGRSARPVVCLAAEGAIRFQEAEDGIMRCLP